MAGFTAFCKFRVVGTVRFYEREEIKDALAYLALAANPRDEVAFRRAVNRPRRGVGARGVEAVLSLRGRTGGDVLQAASLAAGARGGARSGGGLAAFLTVAGAVREALERDPPPSLDRVVLDLLGDSGLLEHYRQWDLTEDTDRQRNLSELVNATAEFPGTREGLSRFLEGVMLNSMDENPFAPTSRSGFSARAASTTQPTIGRPATGWRSLMVFDFSRGPWPAASTRTVPAERGATRRLTPRSGLAR